MSEEKLDLILAGMHEMNEEIRSMKEEVHSVKEDVLSLKEDVLSLKEEGRTMREEIHLIKAQLDENTKLTKAIYQRQEESEPFFRMEIKKLNTAVDAITKDQKSMSSMLGEHEIAIRTLQRYSS